MEARAGTLMQAWMGMHKLATTPMPFPYVQLLYSLLYVYAYSITLPLAVMYEWNSLPVSLLIAFAMFGLNQIGKELEDPFGTDHNDLDFEFFEGAANTVVNQVLPPPVLPSHPDGVGAVEKAPVSKNHPVQGLAEFLQDPDTTSGGRARKEFSAALDPAQLSKEMQTLLFTYFDRYDQNGNGIIDTEKELMQLVSNLVFSLEMKLFYPQLLQDVEQVGAVVSFDKHQFSAWFLEKSRAAMQMQQAQV